MSIFNGLRRSIYALTLASALSLGAACGIHPKDAEKCYPIGYCNNENRGTNPDDNEPTDPVMPPLKITSLPVTDGFVNLEYSYHLKTNRPAQCSLLVSPPWLSLQNNKLYGYPWHISSEEVGLEKIVVRCADGKKNAFQTFDMKIEPGEYCLKNISDGSLTCRLHDHIQRFPIAYTNFEGEEKNIMGVLLCETGHCPRMERDNNGWLERRAEGIAESASQYLNTIQMGPLDDSVEYAFYLNQNSTCNHNLQAYLGGNKLGSVVCDYRLDWMAMAYMYGYKNCLNNQLNPDGSLKYPEACRNPSEYLDPASVEANGITNHELVGHLVDLGNMSGNVEENFASVLQWIISNNNGCRELNSIGDLSQAIGLRYWDSAFLKDLHSKYGFDVSGLPIFFNALRQEYLRDPTRGPRAPVSNSKVKCAADKAVYEFTGVPTSTSESFVNYVCNNPINVTSCNLTIPTIQSYINPEYCGDQFQQYISSSSLSQ